MKKMNPLLKTVLITALILSAINLLITMAVFVTGGVFSFTRLFSDLFYYILFSAVSLLHLLIFAHYGSIVYARNSTVYDNALFIGSFIVVFQNILISNLKNTLNILWAIYRNYSFSGKELDEKNIFSNIWAVIIIGTTFIIVLLVMLNTNRKLPFRQSFIPERFNLPVRFISTIFLSAAFIYQYVQLTRYISQGVFSIGLFSLFILITIVFLLINILCTREKKPSLLNKLSFLASLLIPTAYFAYNRLVFFFSYPETLDKTTVIYFILAFVLDVIISYAITAFVLWKLLYGPHIFNKHTKAIQ